VGIVSAVGGFGEWREGPITAVRADHGPHGAGGTPPGDVNGYHERRPIK
jgi:hypothetical protein